MRKINETKILIITLLLKTNNLTMSVEKELLLWEFYI